MYPIWWAGARSELVPPYVKKAMALLHQRDIRAAERLVSSLVRLRFDELSARVHLNENFVQELRCVLNNIHPPRERGRMSLDARPRSRGGWVLCWGKFEIVSAGRGAFEQSVLEMKSVWLKSKVVNVGQRSQQTSRGW